MTAQDDDRCAGPREEARPVAGNVTPLHRAPSFRQGDRVVLRDKSIGIVERFHDNAAGIVAFAVIRPLPPGVLKRVVPLTHIVGVRS
jgi:hypothetical protein